MLELEPTKIDFVALADFDLGLRDFDACLRVIPQRNSPVGEDAVD